MPKYYKLSDLDNLSVQEIASIRGNATQLQRLSYLKEGGIMEVYGSVISIVFLEKLGWLKGGKYSVTVSGKVNDKHIAASNRDLYDYLVGIMIKAHISWKKYMYETEY